MKNDQKKNLAQELYINGNWFKKDLAAQVGVTPKTIKNWIDEGNWDDLKEIQSITKQTLLADSYKQLKAINKRINDDHDGVPTKELSDAKGVIRKEIEALSDSPLYLYVEVFEEFIDWMSKVEPKQLKDTSKLCYTFLEEKSKRK